MKWLSALDRVVATFWIGGLWVVGYLVAPSLFAHLDDRQLAGQLAGQLFHFFTFIGLGAGVYLLIRTVAQVKARWHHEWRVWALVAMLVLVIVSGFVLQPMMQELKQQGIEAGTAQAGQFGKLHGVSSLLYLGTSVLGLALIVAGLRKGPVDQ